MKKIAIITDSNSGIKPEEVKDTNIFVLPMPFIINGEEYFEDITLTQDKFYDLLAQNVSVLTSQPSTYCIKELWDNVLKEYEYIIHIPMSSGLSGSYETAEALSHEYNGKVHVIDNQRISVTQKQSVLDAQKLAEQGKSVQEITDYLVATKLDASIYIMVPDLKYLKKGGRITTAGAAIGTLLNIKPVLQIQGGKLDAYAKVMSIKQANQKMISAIEKDLTTRFSDYVKDGSMKLFIAYTFDKNNALEFKKQISDKFPNIEIDYVDTLSLSVSCHIGPNALAVSCARVAK